MEDLPEVDYVNVCLEEVALEGLDGITLDALWIRLQGRPNFCMSLDEPAKEYMWEICALHPEIELFELAEARAPLVIYNRFAHVDAETGLIIEPDESIKDIYPFESIKDPNVFGSCATYHTRKPITDVIRREGGALLLSLNEAVDRYGERLVLVASTLARHRVLFGPEADPQLQLVPLQYMMLERIGRSRYLGEVTQGNASLCSLHQCAKTMFYHRKRLIKHSLITKQLHYQRSKPGFIRNGMLLHLTRFYVEHKPKIFVFLQEVCRYLQSRPNRSDTIDNVRAYMGVKNSIIRKTFKKFMSKLIETKRVPVLEANPDADNKDCYFNNGKEKLVSVLRLMDKVNPENLEKILSEEEEGPGGGGGARKKTDDEEGGDGEEDDDDDDDDDEVVVTASIGGIRRRGKLQFAIPDQGGQLIDRPLLNQAYDVFRRCGPEGESLRRVGALLGVPRLESRALCRNLTRSGAITPFMRDSGRQRITNYVAKCYAKSSQSCLELIQDCQNLLTFSKGEEAATAAIGKTTPVSSKPAAAPVQNSENGDGVEQEVKPSTFMEGVKKISAMDKLKDGYAVTPRMVKRMILIVQAVQECRVVDSYVKLLKLITSEETKEGYFCRIDRRSVLRIIHILSKEGFVRSIKTILKHGDKEQRVHLICDPSVKNDDSLVINSLEQAKFRHFSVSRETLQTTVSDENVDSVHSSVLELRNLYGPASQAEKTPMLHNPITSKRHGMLYGFEPKFRRMKTIHHFLFYLAHDYAGSTDCLVPEEVAALQEEERFDLPKVYHTERSWMMFVAPLPQHTGWRKGWCLFSDVILRMPLCIFLRLYNVNYLVEGLADILDHPIKRNFPLSHLPQSIRRGLLITRKYIFTLYEILTRLVYMGLVSFSHRAMKDKDQVFVFVHRHARVVDTTASAPAYHLVSDNVNYVTHKHQLKTLETLTDYWVNLESVCLHTPLGFFTVVQGKRFTFEIMSRKPELMAALASKTDEEIVDDGTIPGDGRGAGGLDSTFFAHLKRNWNWVNLVSNYKKGKDSALGPKAKHDKTKGEAKHALNRDGENSVFINFLRKKGSQIKFAENAKQRLTRLAIANEVDRHLDWQQEGGEPTRSLATAAKPKKRKKKNESTKAAIPAKKNRGFERTMQRPKPKARQPYYDDVDRVALQMVRRRRVTWSSKEDSMLLLCKVASSILRPDKKFLYVPFTVIRDFMHRHLKASADKTSKAVQRRLHYMMQLELTNYNVSVFIGEANQDQEILDCRDDAHRSGDNTKARKDVFETLMLKLMDKVKAALPAHQAVTYDLPDTIEAFERRFAITRADGFCDQPVCYTDVKNVVDIHFNVVCALIMSSLMTKDGRHWSYLLYQVYQQYPEILLTSALTRLRITRIVCRRKNIGKQMSYKSLLLTLPYQLSNRYDYLMTSRYRLHIYSEAMELAEKLRRDCAGERAGIPIVPDHDHGGYAAVVVALAATRNLLFDLSIPDEVVVMQTKKLGQSKTLSERVEGLECVGRSGDKATWSVPLHGATSTSGSCAPTKGSGDSAQPPLAKRARKEREETDEMVASTSDVVGTSASVSGVSTNAVPTASSEARIETVSHSSRVALYMMRRQMTSSNMVNIQHAHDYLDISHCQVSCRIADGAPCVSEAYVEQAKTCLRKILEKESVFLSSTAVPVSMVEARYRSLGHDQDVVDEMLSLYGQISQRRELGATARELNRWFYGIGRRLGLCTHLDLMSEEQLVVRVGVVNIHYVALVFAKPWLVHSFELPPFPSPPPLTSTSAEEASNKMQDCASTSVQDGGASAVAMEEDTEVVTDPWFGRIQTRAKSRRKMFRRKVAPTTNIVQEKQNQLHFVCPPWRKPDGGINVTQLESVLCSINGYVMSNPGISQKHLFDKFGLAFTPVQILSLLQMLEKAGCLSRTMIKHSHKPMLFAPRVVISENTQSAEERLDETENSSLIFYSADVESCVKLAQLFKNK